MTEHDWQAGKWKTRKIRREKSEIPLDSYFWGWLTVLPCTGGQPSVRESADSIVIPRALIFHSSQKPLEKEACSRRLSGKIMTNFSVLEYLRGTCLPSLSTLCIWSNQPQGISLCSIFPKVLFFGLSSEAVVFGLSLSCHCHFWWGMSCVLGLSGQLGSTDHSEPDDLAIYC